ncbi:DUF6276 family protein [Haloplanus salinarum]|jgi:hypothetical protein|uniref:DUF6276 family protein n=1 Tax=Haloplanus salinarum TaxID=1912324 RepID=UPI00214B099A|nr:DUF6276 family protein [Haloplanus salinarum]
MPCPACGTATLSFPVPPALREHAPEAGDAAAICPTCLRTHAVDADTESPDFSTVHPAFPSGEAGAALALALGLLDSLALRRDAVDACCAHAERAGADVLLALDRLAGDAAVDPHVDLDRRRRQLAELLR